MWMCTSLYIDFFCALLKSEHCYRGLLRRIFSAFQTEANECVCRTRGCFQNVTLASMVVYLYSLYFGEVFSPLTPAVLLCICSNCSKPSTNQETPNFMEYTNAYQDFLELHSPEYWTYCMECCRWSWTSHSSRLCTNRRKPNAVPQKHASEQLNRNKKFWLLLSLNSCVSQYILIVF